MIAEFITFSNYCVIMKQTHPENMCTTILLNFRDEVFF